MIKEKSEELVSKIPCAHVCEKCIRTGIALVSGEGVLFGLLVGVCGQTCCNLPKMNLLLLFNGEKNDKDFRLAGIVQKF